VEFGFFPRAVDGKPYCDIDFLRYLLSVLHTLLWRNKRADFERTGRSISGKIQEMQVQRTTGLKSRERFVNLNLGEREKVSHEV
jgi:hypothetical protein